MAIGYFLPISVTDVTYMFNGCYRLHGGIPEYFVQVVREITDDGTTTIRSSIDSLAGIFAQTAILYGNVQSYTLNISEMFPNVTNVEGMFYWHTANTSYSGGMQALNAQCFSKCTSCENLFNSASIKIPLNCDFSSATSMRYAFATRL
jgi:hypothetical protein